MASQVKSRGVSSHEPRSQPGLMSSACEADTCIFFVWTGVDRKTIVEIIQKYSARLREAKTPQEYSTAYTRGTNIFGAKRFQSRDETDEDTWDSVIPCCDLSGVSGDKLSDLKKANKIPYNPLRFG